MHSTVRRQSAHGRSAFAAIFSEIVFAKQNNSFSSKEEESFFLKDHDGTKNVCIFMMILNFILVKKKNQNQVTYNNKTKTQYIFWGAITC